jgi:hypothetical protein
MVAGSWTLAMELFTQGDSRFVDEIRRVHAAERLGDFAATWIADARPFARQALLDYLAQPFNCYRHEALVKRLFKLAEKAGDDVLMGAFLVACDRFIRRVRKTITRHKHEQFDNPEAAEAAIRRWAADGFDNANINSWSGRTYAYASKSEEAVVMPANTAMPRPAKSMWKRNESLPDNLLQRYAKRFRLFSVPTRRYLRRRAWRYFRTIGKTDPSRYLLGTLAFLPRYTDEDTASDINLLDNWGLVHALFAHSPALAGSAMGWDFAPGRSLNDLAPAPRFERVWRENPQALFDVLFAAQARVVRQWALWMLRMHHEVWLAARPIPTLLRLVDHAEAELSNLGFDLLEHAEHLEEVPIEEWLLRLGGDNFEKLRRLSDLLTRKFDSSRIPLDDALRLAGYRSKPVAEFGLGILKKRTFTEQDASVLLPLVQAESEAVRPDLIRWLRSTLEGFGNVQAKWLLEFLDSKHQDVRAAGWEWLNNSSFVDDTSLWHHLIESPYDDLRGPLIEHLQVRAKGADPASVQLLWASVLLNIARGGRYKPGIVAQVASRLAEHTTEADRLLPLLAVAVRSLRGPEFRAGLAGVVSLAERKPDLLPLIRQKFPELEF